MVFWWNFFRTEHEIGEISGYFMLESCVATVDRRIDDLSKFWALDLWTNNNYVDPKYEDLWMIELRLIRRKIDVRFKL